MPRHVAQARRTLGLLPLVLAVVAVAPAGLPAPAADVLPGTAHAAVPLPPKPYLRPIPPRTPVDPHPGASICDRKGVLCPDLAMRAPYDLTPDLHRGRRMLRAANTVLSIGSGPVEVRGRRSSLRKMKATQWVYRAGGRKPVRVKGGAGHIIHKAIPGQGRIWKFQNAAQFELWTVEKPRKLVRRGAKLTYCLRDLGRLWTWDRSPRRIVYPACPGNDRQRVTLGTSAGWGDIYPAAYYEQWIDVHGLRGCFELLHVADPLNHIVESDETNNSAKTQVRLPMGRDRVSTKC